MNHRAAPLTETAHRLTTALRRETSLARAVALDELTACVMDRRAALAAFGAAGALAPAHTPEAQQEHAAMQDLLDAAIENALVLEAVQAMLQDTAHGAPGSPAWDAPESAEWVEVPPAARPHPRFRRPALSRGSASRPEGSPGDGPAPAFSHTVLPQVR